MDIQFKTQKELYSRVKPALDAKISEFRMKKIDYIKAKDIWNYLSINSWKNAESLDLAKMVSDIFAVSEEDMKNFVHDILREQKRELGSGDGDIL